MKPVGQKVNKQQQLAELREKYSKVTDRLKKPVDEGILETVVLLNALNINTTGSCKGHLDWGIAAPWVDVSAPETEQLKQIWQRYFQLRKLASNKEAQDASIAEIKAIYKETGQIESVAKKHTVEKILPQVLGLLNEFYQNRAVPNDQRLILREIGWTCRIISQGAVIQEILPVDQRQANLTRYRQEMQVFTEFLKNKFLQD